MGSVGVAVLVTAFAFGPGVATRAGAAFTEIAFPVADVLLLMAVVGVFALMAWRPGPSWQLLGAGLAVLAVGDSWYLLRLVDEVHAQGAVVDAWRPVGVVLLGLAAWKASGEHRLRPEGCVVLAMPTLVVTSALGVLVYGHFSSISHVAVVLAAATLVAAMLRTAFIFRELRTLADTRRQASTDELTGLGNRRLFYDRLTAALARRGEGESLGLLLIDLDRFKEINNTLGHHVGDMLLRELGPRLSGALRSSDLLVRLGGDEFAVLLGRSRDAVMAEVVAQRLLDTLHQPFVLEGVSFHVDASIGIALAPDHAVDRDTLLQRADVAMYQAKRANSGYHVYEAHGDVNSRDRLETIEQLRTAVDQGQLLLHYQPKFALGASTVVGVEALVRWAHPERGLIYPDSFIGLAEQTGIMRPLTLSVIDMALGQCRVWRDEGIPLKVAVNLSVSTLLDTRLIGDVNRLLRKWDLLPSALELEITENVLMVNPVRAQEVLGAFRSLGVTVSVDDYGTGYSSLAYLRQLKLDELKLGSTFVTNMAEEPGAAAIVRSTVELAHSLGLRIVAEGVETEEVLSLLTDIGCDMAQGFYISRPKPADELTDWLGLRSTALAVG